MGCQQSVPVEGNLSSGQNGPKAPLQAEFFEREVSKALESTRSTTAPPSCTSVATTRTAFSSSTVSLAVDEDDSYTLPKVDYNGRLLKEEIVKRTSASIQSSSLSLGRGAKQFELQYAYRSQRGYNPQDPLKPNQDKHGITLNFGSEGGDAMIGVYSGHGERGKQCADFCETTLPKQLAKFIRQKRLATYSAQLKTEGKTKQGAWNPNAWPFLSKVEYENACKRAFRETKCMLQQQEEIKDKQSGASALTVCFHGGRMYVASVGGCGAILGRRSSRLELNYEEEEKCEIESPENNGRRTAITLVDDHTLCCQEELERIKLAGAEVQHSLEDEYTSLFYDSEETSAKGNGNSLRAFVPGVEGPGTKFTRSICDSSLDDIGIISDPSITSCDLTSEDEILIVASNAVFAFLSNQEIMDICSSYYDPLEASEAVTKAVYDKWIEQTNRCDDITVIVCYFSNLCEPVQRIKMPSDLLGMMDDNDGVMHDDEDE